MISWATHAPPYNAPSDAAPERAAARSQQRRLQCPVSGDRDRTRQGDPPGALSAGLDGPCRRGLRTGGLSEASRVRIRRPPKKIPPPESPKGAEDSSTGRRNTMGVVLRQLISGMASGHGERDRRTSPCNVTLQRHPATSPCNVTLQRHPATSPCNVTLQRHPPWSWHCCATGKKCHRRAACSFQNQGGHARTLNHLRCQGAHDLSPAVFVVRCAPQNLTPVAHAFEQSL